MKTKVIFLLVALFALTTGMQAQNWKKNKHHRPVKVEKRYNHPAKVKPHRSRTVAVLPHGYSQIRHDNRVYYYARGVYYRPAANRYYEVVLPHIGMIVPALPVYTQVMYRGRPYYSYQNYLYTPVRTPHGFNFRVDIRL